MRGKTTLLKNIIFSEDTEEKDMSLGRAEDFYVLLTASVRAFNKSSTFNKLFGDEKSFPFLGF